MSWSIEYAALDLANFKPFSVLEQVIELPTIRNEVLEVENALKGGLNLLDAFSNRTLPPSFSLRYGAEVK